VTGDYQHSSSSYELLWQFDQRQCAVLESIAETGLTFKLLNICAAQDHLTIAILNNKQQVLTLLMVKINYFNMAVRLVEGVEY